MMNDASATEQIDGPRACSLYELAPALDVGTAVMRLEQNMPPTWGHSWPHVYCSENLENIRIIKANHQVVSSMAIFTTMVRAQSAAAEAVTLTVGGINGVATLPSFRRRGFARQLLRDCHAKMEVDGCDIALLSTGIDNWYRRFGWERGATQWTFTIDRGSYRYLPALGGAMQVDEATTSMSALAEVRVLHKKELLGAQRRSEIDPLLLTRLGSRVVIARQNARLLAYIVLRNNQILEHGGTSEVAAGLVRAVFEREDDSTRSTSGRDDSGAASTLHMTIYTAPVNLGLGSLLSRLGFPLNRSYLGMIRIINAKQLLQKVAPHLIVEENNEEEVVVRDRSNRYRIDRREMVKWLFGPERNDIIPGDVLPVTFYQWPLDWV